MFRMIFKFNLSNVSQLQPQLKTKTARQTMQATQTITFEITILTNQLIHFKQFFNRFNFDICHLRDKNGDKTRKSASRRARFSPSRISLLRLLILSRQNSFLDAAELEKTARSPDKQTSTPNAALGFGIFE